MENVASNWAALLLDKQKMKSGQLIKLCALLIALGLSFVSLLYAPNISTPIGNVANAYFYFLIVLTFGCLWFPAAAIIIVVSLITVGSYFCIVEIFSPILFIIYMMSALFYFIFWRLHIETTTAAVPNK